MLIDAGADKEAMNNVRVVCCLNSSLCRILNFLSSNLTFLLLSSTSSSSLATLVHAYDDFSSGFVRLVYIMFHNAHFLPSPFIYTILGIFHFEFILSFQYSIYLIE